MDPQKKKKIIIWASAGCVVLAAVVAALFLTGKGPVSQTGAPGIGGGISSPAGITQVSAPTSAYGAAFARAKTWQSGAALIKVILNDSTGSEWTYVFVSPKNKGKGFAVTTNGNTVTAAGEVPFEGGGTALPANIVSPDAAMAAARTVPGYANAKIVSLEMIYNAAAKQWYWGVKTATGVTVTVKATP